MHRMAVVLVMAALVAEVAAAGTVTVWPAPEGEKLSQDFSVTVDGKASPVYIARVAPEKQELRWKAMDDKANSADYYEKPPSRSSTCKARWRSSSLVPLR